MSAKTASSTRARSAGFTSPAFTLVELLVVIGIIAILVGLLVTVIPKVKRAVYGAQTSAQLSALSNAIQQYYSDFKAYPGPLGNNQLGSAYDPNGTPSFPDSRFPQAAGFPLTGTINGQSIPSSAFNHITGSQNLTLAILGGLDVQYNTNQVATAFTYNATDIFPDGHHPGPIGASSLNPNNPRRQQSYLQVRQGDITVPGLSTFALGGTNGSSFADGAGRSPTDAPIPVFLDKYPDPLPIIYMRTNMKAQAIVGVRNTNGNGTQLVDSAAQGNYGLTVTETPQYDLCQLFDYSKSKIGVIANSAQNYHGLQGLGNANLTDTIKSGYMNNGLNGIAYFRDPNFKVDPNNPSNNYDPLASNTHAGVAREKDGFLLITAGPDRIYGTNDDIIFPGTLLVSQ